MTNEIPMYEARIYPDALSWFTAERDKAIPYLSVYSDWLKNNGFVFDGRGWTYVRNS